MPSPCFLPAGMEMPFAGPVANIPAGWLPSDGSAVSRSTYGRLFAAIGTTWGVGDGSTTFNLPDRRGRNLRGVNGTDPGATGGATNHTPAGTNNAPAFTGNAATLTGTVAAPTFTGTPATLTGTVSTPTISWPAGVPTFNGTLFAQSSATNGVNFNACTSTKPSGTIAWPAGVPTNSAPTLTMNSYTPAGTNSAPALTMNSYTPGGTNSAPALTMNSYTPTGSVAAPTFTGTSADFSSPWGDTIWLIKT